MAVKSVSIRIEEEMLQKISYVAVKPSGKNETAGGCRSLNDQAKKDEIQ